MEELLKKKGKIPQITQLKKIAWPCAFAILFFKCLSLSYATEENVIWAKSFGNLPTYIANAAGVATDSNNNVIVTGTTNMQGGWIGDYCTVKYDSDGNYLWAKFYYTGTGEEATGVAIDSNNNIIVTGATGVNRGTSDSYFTIKYDPSGNVLWSKTYDTGGNDMARGVAADSQNNIIVTGSTGIIKYDSDGNILWIKTDADGGIGSAIATDSTNNVIVTGYNGGNYIIKYDSNGNVLWNVKGDKPYYYSYGATTDSNNNIVIALLPIGGDTTYFTIKYNPDGNVLWNKAYNNSTAGLMSGGVTTDSNNNVIVTFTSRGSDYSYYGIKYDPNGNELWSKVLYDSGEWDRAAGVATDSNDNIIVTGASSNQYYTIKYKSSPTIQILDGADFSAGREVTDDPEKLIDEGTPVDGAVTDGVTRLLLRLSVDKFGPVTLTLQGTGNPKEDGVLRVLRSIDNNFQEGNTVTVNTVAVNAKQYAFVIYQAPENFVRDSYQEEDKKVSERKLSIKVESSSISPIQKEIKLVRPTLILVHGLWDGPEMWDGFIIMLKNKIPDIKIFTVDYKETNASYLDINKNKIADRIALRRDELRAEGIAMIQADILGHSMGGVLGRIRVESDMWSGVEEYHYHRKLNFETGDIHKLITLDSPHFGSFLCDRIIAIVTFIKDNDPITWDLMLKFFEYIKHPLDQGAIENLQTMSIEIRLLNSVPTDSASHAIVGDYVANGGLSLVPGPIGLIYGALQKFGYDASVDIPLQSDLIISAKNQAGGLIFPASSTFNHYHTAATTEEVADKVAELLNAELKEASFESGFPINKWPEF